MKRILNFLICRLLPLFSNRRLSITGKSDSTPGKLFVITTVEPETNTKSDHAQDEKRIQELQESARSEAVNGIKALSSVLLKRYDPSEIKILVSGSRADVLRPIQAKFPHYFSTFNQTTAAIAEALYWETDRK